MSAYVRRRGHAKADAEDLGQAFFARFLAKNYLEGLSAERGRFRALLLAALKNFLINEWKHANRQKRGGGGGETPLSLDWETADTKFQVAATPTVSTNELGASRADAYRNKCGKTWGFSISPLGRGEGVGFPKFGCGRPVAARLRLAEPTLTGIRENWTAARTALDGGDSANALVSLRRLAPHIQAFREKFHGTSLEAGTTNALELVKSLSVALEKSDKDAAQIALEAMKALGRNMEEQIKAINESAEPGNK